MEDGNHPNLPPLMNPTMLEASDDLTNLSHLNEPAGTIHLVPEAGPLTLNEHILTGYQSCKRFGYDTSKRRFTHTVVSS